MPGVENVNMNEVFESCGNDIVEILKRYSLKYTQSEGFEQNIITEIDSFIDKTYIFICSHFCTSKKLRMIL